MVTSYSSVGYNPSHTYIVMAELNLGYHQLQISHTNLWQGSRLSVANSTVPLSSSLRPRVAGCTDVNPFASTKQFGSRSLKRLDAHAVLLIWYHMRYRSSSTASYRWAKTSYSRSITRYSRVLDSYDSVVTTYSRAVTSYGRAITS